MFKKLRLLSIILLVSLLSAQLTFADALAYDSHDHSVDYYVVVSASDGGCNFRYGPGVEYGQIISDMIPNGTVLHVTREANAANGKPWGFVAYNRNSGWIALSQVSVTNAPSSGSAVQADGENSADVAPSTLKRASYDVTVSASDGGCNLRYGPGVEYNQLMNYMIPNGTILHIHWEDEASNGKAWGFTNYNNMTGWIALSQVSVTNVNSSVSAVNYRVKAAAPEGGINLRSGAGVDYQILLSGLIPNGTALSISQETRAASNGRFWGYTTYNGVSGWVTLEQVIPIAETLSGNANSTTSGGAVGKAEEVSGNGPLIAAAQPGFLQKGFIAQLIVLAVIVAAAAVCAARVLKKRS